MEYIAIRLLILTRDRPRRREHSFLIRTTKVWTELSPLSAKILSGSTIAAVAMVNSLRLLQVFSDLSLIVRSLNWTIDRPRRVRYMREEVLTVAELQSKWSEVLYSGRRTWWGLPAMPTFREAWVRSVMSGFRSTNCWSRKKQERGVLL